MSNVKAGDIKLIISAFVASKFLGAIVTGFFVFYWVLKGKDAWQDAMKHAAGRLDEIARDHQTHDDNTNAGDTWQP